MMRFLNLRIAALVTAVVVVASCDTRLPAAAVTPDATELGFPPVTIIDTPLVGQLVNLGDSVYLSLRLGDDNGVSSATVTGFTMSGDADLGTLQQVVRFGPLRIPAAAGNFRAGLLDTVVRRYLRANNPATLVPDSLIVQVTTTDVEGLTSTARVTVQLVSGPRVTINAPTSGDSIAAGSNIAVEVRTTHPDGVDRMIVRVRGENTWPTLLDTSITTTYPTLPRDVETTVIVPVPADATPRGRVTITAEARDANQQPGAAPPVTQFILTSAVPPAPRVTQTVSGRSELTDTVTVRATGGGITTLGLLIRDGAGATVKDTSIALPQPYTANAVRNIALNLPISAQGQHLTVTGYAIDQDNRTGYAIRSALSGPVTNLALALAESTLVVYGRTFALPRQGVVGDIAVDEALGNVFVSSMDHNRLEVWQNGPKSFDPLGVAVGSQPWGLNVSINSDTLLVANSGGDNISRVFIGSTTVSDIRENLQARIRTRSNFIFQVTETRDQNTGKITLRLRNPPFMYSDRPQYVGQVADGTIFFSTRPTAERPEGVIRYLNPAQQFPDMKTFLIVGSSTPATTFLIIDADDVQVRPTAAASNLPDTLIIFSHTPGTNQTPVGFVSTDGVGAAVAGINALTGNTVFAVAGVEPAGLTDTTFVAMSRNREWIGFGTGNTASAGNVMMQCRAIALGTCPGAAFGSPILAQADLRNNAAERIFGLAIDSTGLTVAARGVESYFASVDMPFHLRLQGKYSSFAQGAGMAFHPAARGGLAVYADDRERTAFVASDNFRIEVVDIAHFVNRGRLDVKNRLYGPLRVTRALPGDPPDVVVKVYGITDAGLVVIDLRAADILPVP